MCAIYGYGVSCVCWAEIQKIPNWLFKSLAKAKSSTQQRNKLGKTKIYI